MTCIVGLIDKGKIYIGGDCAGISGYSRTLRADAKVFENGGMFFGFTSSFRMGDILRYSLKVPEFKRGEDLQRFMRTKFINEVRAVLKAGGFSSINNGNETGGTFLVGFRGRLFRVDDDFQVGEGLDKYAAVGCGEEIALGSLFSTKGKHPKYRVEKALEASAYHNSGVSAPFKIINS